MAVPPPGAAGGAEHEAGNGVFREPAEKEACGCRRNPPVRQGLPGLPGGDKETGGACCWNTGSSGTCTRRAIPNGGRSWTP
ncbi:hypothetical protein NXX21_20445 [Bacteroides thetaiotaomicron]|nr:hypothetical protein [Bacteroides thetaiotaomicron]